mgnify:CR=1 FL=1
MMFFFHNKEDKELINAINFILGYKTNKPELYKLALLHKSIKTEESNERLEFLGDAILGLIVAKYLFKLYPFKADLYFKRSDIRGLKLEDYTGAINDLNRGLELDPSINPICEDLYFKEAFRKIKIDN